MKAPRVLMPRWRCQSYITIKLLIASFYTHIDEINFAACRIQNHRETQGVGNDRG